MVSGSLRWLASAGPALCDIGTIFWHAILVQIGPVWACRIWLVRHAGVQCGRNLSGSAASFQIWSSTLAHSMARCFLLEGALFHTFARGVEICQGSGSFDRYFARACGFSVGRARWVTIDDADTRFASGTTGSGCQNCGRRLAIWQLPHQLHSVIRAVDFGVIYPCRQSIPRQGVLKTAPASEQPATCARVRSL